MKVLPLRANENLVNDHVFYFAVSGCENGSLIPDSEITPTGTGTSSTGFSSAHARVVTSSSSAANPRAHVRGVSRAKVKTVKLTITVIGQKLYLVCTSCEFMLGGQGTCRWQKPEQ